MSSLREEIERAFDPDVLKAICELHEFGFADLAENMVLNQPEEKWPEDIYYYQDNGADILYVAHLDTVVSPFERTATFAQTHDGLVVHSGALDDRLGAYVGLHLLPSLGYRHDILLTTGEEMGRSTAAHFTPEKEYNWMIEFDRGGTDVVMYDYEDTESANLVRQAGARVGIGSFTDICYLDHLEVKGFNWGVGYTGDYHSVRGYAFLEDTFDMVEKYLDFYDENLDVYLPHERPKYKSWKTRSSSSHWWDDDDLSIPADVIEDIEDIYGPEAAHGDDEFAALREQWVKDREREERESA